MHKEEIRAVFIALKERRLNPAGTFDKGGRWYACNSDLISVRAPSRSWPYSQLNACRTLKYVKAVAKKFNCADEDALRLKV